MKGELKMSLYINGEEISEEAIKKYGLNPGNITPFSATTITTVPDVKSELVVRALRRMDNQEACLD